MRNCFCLSCFLSKAHFNMSMIITMSGAIKIFWFIWKSFHLLLFGNKESCIWKHYFVSRWWCKYYHVTQLHNLIIDYKIIVSSWNVFLAKMWCFSFHSVSRNFFVVSKEGWSYLLLPNSRIKVIVTYAITNDYRSLMMFYALINNNIKCYFFLDR